MLDDLKREYPDLAVVGHPAEDPSEIFVETERNPATNSSMTVAIVERMARHRHQVSKELIVVESGILLMRINNRRHLLEKGESVEIKPGEVHSGVAMGQEPVRLRMTITPPWSYEDHIIEPDDAAAAQALTEVA
jgi:mannose-6-phosphate isomerase-like protein (cupin superfamily)